MQLLILFFVATLVTSFLCSLLEAVILSVTHMHVTLMVKQGRRTGRLLKSLKENIEAPLAAILTLNTIANTVGAVGVGAQALKVFGDRWVAAISILFTFMILVISEIIPKTLGAAHWKTLAPTCAYIIKFMLVVLYPFVLLSRSLSRVLVDRHVKRKTVSREEMIVVAETGHEEGVLVEREKKIIKNLLLLNHIYAEDVMTPRSVIFSLQKDAKVGDVVERQSAPIFFSRIPVYNKGIDDVIGMVLRVKIIEAFSKDQENLTIEQLTMPIHSVPTKKSVAEVLDEFLKRKEHLFIVSDGHGGTAGLISLEDVIETLLGVEIVDEFDSVEDLRKFAIEQWENRKKLRPGVNIGKIDVTVGIRRS